VQFFITRVVAKSKTQCHARAAVHLYNRSGPGQPSHRGYKSELKKFIYSFLNAHLWLVVVEMSRRDNRPGDAPSNGQALSQRRIGGCSTGDQE